MLQYSFNLGFFFFFLPLKREYLGISLEYTLDTVGVTTNKWQRCFSEFPHSQTLRNFSLTCTGTHCKAHSPLGSVKDDIKSFHDCSTNDQSICGGGDAESVALQIISYHKDGLNIKLLKRKKKLKNESQSAKSNTSQQVRLKSLDIFIFIVQARKFYWKQRMDGANRFLYRM